MRAGAKPPFRIPPELLAQRAELPLEKFPLVSDAGTPPLSGRVLLDMPEWVVQRSQAFVPFARGEGFFFPSVDSGGHRPEKGWLP